MGGSPLPHQDPSALGPFDGLSACTLGNWIITSPNSQTIPFPQWDICAVRLRSDYRYGTHDYTLWTQPYIKEFCHLGAIPSKPPDPSDPLSVMWWNPKETDFVLQSGSLLNGFGKVSSYLQNVDKNRALRSLLKTMEHSSSRLEWCTSSYSEMRFAVTELQRYYLEVHGLIDYLEVYKPRMDGISECTNTSVAPCIGAFTSSPSVVQDFFAAGIPVFFIRPVEAIAKSPPQILNGVEPLLPKVVCSDASPPFPIVYKGHINKPEKHIGIHNYTRTWMVYKSPYDEQRTPQRVNLFATSGPTPNSFDVRAMEELLAEPMAKSSVPPSCTLSTTPSLSLSRQAPGPRRPLRMQPSPRDPFSDYKSPLLPPNISFWSAGLQLVDDSGHTYKVSYNAEYHREFRCYALPDPHLFVTPGDDAKKTIYLLTWLRARPALLYRLQRERCLMHKLQVWREFLELLGRNSGTSEVSRAADIRRMISEIFGPLVESFGTGKVLTADAPPVYWRDRRLSPTSLPPQWVFHEVLWELNEINFRFELLALDVRASKLDIPLDRRLKRIMFCFPYDEFIPSYIPRANEGLAATHWSDRVPYVVSLVGIMRDWPHARVDDEFYLTPREKEGRFRDEGTFRKVEDYAIWFYCQSFWCTFGRAAILPRRITN